MTVLRLTAIYFGLVFGAGIVFGTLRVLFLVPLLGDRWAELFEAPWMLVAIMLSCNWLVRKNSAPPRSWLLAGLGAAGLVLVADVGVGIALRGMTLREVFIERDPVAGAVYYSLVLVFAFAPWLIARAGPPSA